MAAGLIIVPATALAEFGIDPGKVHIDNLHPGSQAEVPIVLYNRNDEETAFKMAVRNPDYTDPGYEVFEHPEWITITPDRVAVSANGKAQVTVSIAMPGDADYSGKKAEVWISFMQSDAPGNIKLEVASRLFITTRTEPANAVTIGAKLGSSPAPEQISPETAASPGESGAAGGQELSGFQAFNWRAPVIIGLLLVLFGLFVSRKVRARK